MEREVLQAPHAASDGEQSRHPGAALPRPGRVIINGHEVAVAADPSAPRDLPPRVRPTTEDQGPGRRMVEPDGSGAMGWVAVLVALLGFGAIIKGLW